MYVVGNIPQTDYKVKGITMERTIFNEHTGELLHGMRVNPNKYLFDDNGYIDSYSQFTNTVDEMLLSRGITGYAIQRLDFRIDNYKNSFDELYKLNNIVINLLSMVMGIKDCYKSLKNDVPHNIVARGNGQEIECYNRTAKNGNGLTKTRVELRRTFSYFRPIAPNDISNIYSDWLSILRSKLMPIYYGQFQAMQNDRIAQENIQRCKVTRTVIELLAKNRDYICTSKQMGELCSKLNLAKDVAYTYKNRLKIEYYKYADIERYLNNIIMALHTFLTT